MEDIKSVTEQMFVSIYKIIYKNIYSSYSSLAQKMRCEKLIQNTLSFE